MAGPTFVAVPPDLVRTATNLWDHFVDLGYRLKAEPVASELPTSPTMIAHRQHATMIIEVRYDVSVKLARDWEYVARSRARETRIAFGVPLKAVVQSEKLATLVDSGVGLYRVGDGRVIEEIPPHDLALNLHLPPLHDAPMRVRAVLGDAYEKFGRSEWREGFKSAAGALEVFARKGLVRRVKSGGALPSAGGGPSMTVKQINKLTMGQLAAAYGRIPAPTKIDSMIGAALGKVNKDRVGATHHGSSVKTELRLRTNVQRLMWTIVQVLRAAM